MKNLSLYHWFIAAFSAMFFHAALALSWGQLESPQIEKSVGAPVIAVGSLTAFAEQQAVEETIEQVSKPSEDLSELKPIESAPELIEEPLISKNVAIEPEPVKEAVLPVTQPKQQVKKAEQKKFEKKKIAKKETRKQLKRIAGKQLAALKKGGGAKGRQQRNAGRAVISNYRGRVQSHLARYKSSPGNGVRGRVVVSFQISRSGGVRGVRLVRGSGNGTIDRAALSMVRRASPFPPIPAAGPSNMQFTVPVSYH